MADGKAVIISDAVGASYLAKAGANALVFPSGDSASLARAFVHALSDRQVLAGLGAGARATVDQEFEAPKIIAEHVVSYERAVSQRQLRRESSLFSFAASPLVAQMIRVAETKDELSCADLRRWDARRLTQELFDRARDRLAVW